MKMLGVGAGAVAVTAAASPSFTSGRATIGGVDVKHERNPRMPATWLCHGVARDGKRTFAMTVDYTDEDAELLGSREVVDAASAFVVKQLTGPERDFFEVRGMERPKKRQRWINADGSLDWRQLCPECWERMDSWRGLCPSCKAAS